MINQKVVHLIHEGKAILKLRSPLLRQDRYRYWKRDARSLLKDGSISRPLALQVDKLREDIGVIGLMASQQLPGNDEKMGDRSRSVFVVHGRNEKLREAVFSFLRALTLQPVEWTQAVAMTGKGSPFVGEVLDVAFEKAQAIVVVLSPDDEARLRGQFRRSNDPDYERTLTPQARPNVLFEAGMALGRHPDRAILLEVGRLRPFSDIAGRHTVRMDGSAKKRQELAERLKKAGCTVDTSGTDWLQVGTFEV